MNDARTWLVHSDDGNDGPLTLNNCTDYRGVPLPVFTLVRKNLQTEQTPCTSDTNVEKFSGTIPSVLLGADWIRTRKADSSGLLDFLIGYESSVYVAVDSSVAVPSWITAGGFDPVSGGTLAPEPLVSPFAVYEKIFGPGALISLGDGGVTKYIAIGEAGLSRQRLCPVSPRPIGRRS